jgi:hypothetical protein
METTTQIDKIISEVNTLDAKSKIILLKKIEEIFEVPDQYDDENISLKSAFGLWKNRSISLESIREKAWR